MTEEVRGTREPAPSGEEHGTDPKMWVIGPGGPDCDHPPGERRDIGSDGRNGYYQCDRCGAGIVLQNEAYYRAN